jgi:hypothetical protein
LKLLVQEGKYEKTTLRWLLVSKIQVGGFMGNLLLGFFIVHLKDLENFFIILSLNLQGIDVGFDGS